MALQFDSGAYGRAYQQGEENRLANENQPLETMQMLGQAVSGYQKGVNQRQQNDREKQLYELKLAEAMRQKRTDQEMDTPYSQLLSSGQLSGEVAPQSLLDKYQAPMGQGEAAMPQQPRRSLIDDFRSGAWKGRLNQPPQVNMGEQDITSRLQSLGLPPEAANMTPRQLKMTGEARKMFQDVSPDTIPSDVFPMIASGDFQGVAGKYPKGVPLKIANLATNAGYKQQGMDYKIATAEEKKQAELKRAQETWDARRNEAYGIMKKIDDILPKVTGTSSGAIGQMTEGVPFFGQWSGATNLGADLDSILSDLGLNKLMELKSNSKVGASGMGALSDREMTLLTSAITSLKQSQDEKQLETNLGKVKQHYGNLLEMMEGRNPYGTGQPQQNEGQPSGLMWQGKPIKDTPANRAWLAKQKGGQR